MHVWLRTGWLKETLTPSTCNSSASLQYNLLSIYSLSFVALFDTCGLKLTQLKFELRIFFNKLINIINERAQKI